MNQQLESRLKKLERQNRLLVLLLGCAILLFVLSGVFPDDAQTLRCQRLEVVDENNKLVAMLGVDKDGSRGLFVHDKNDKFRVATIHDDNQSAFYAFDTSGTVRIGIAQFAHGGGGVALHGEASKGGAVLYYKNGGSLSFFDTEGKTTFRVPEKK